MVGIDRRRVRLSLIAAVVIGGVLGSLLPAAAGPAAVTSVGGLEPAELTAIDIDGPYAFVSLGVTGAKWSHRSTLTADGRLSAFRPSYEHPDYGIQDDHLELIDTMCELAVDAALRGEPGVIGHDEERGDELRPIEFARIAGGKPFDITQDWYLEMLQAIGQDAPVEAPPAAH